MTKKPIQHFDKEYLRRTKDLSADQIIHFLEDFRKLHLGAKVKEKPVLISLKVPPELLNSFRTICQGEGIPYQTQIKKLMSQWMAEKQRPIEH